MSDAAPHKSLARDIIISVVAASGIMAFIVAVAAQFAIDWIREGVETQGLQGFWFPLVVTLVIVLAAGTVLALLALSILRARWRKRIWAPAACWVWTRRPVSARRFENELTTLGGVHNSFRMNTMELLNGQASKLQTLSERSEEALGQVRSSVTNVSLSLAKKHNEQQKRIDALLREVEDINKKHRVLQKQLGDVRESVGGAGAVGAAPPASSPSLPLPPLPLPRWRLIDPRNRTDAHLEDGKFLVLNLVKGSVAKNVRLDNDGAGYFEFEDGASWPEISGGDVYTFEGEIARADRGGEVRIKLTWYDEQSRQRSTSFWYHRDGTFRPIHEEGLRV